MQATRNDQFGRAAWYDLVGKETASGEILDTVTATAAHRSLPLDSFAKVTDLDNGRSVIVKINDRGPYTRGRIIDLSPRAADVLHMKAVGVGSVVIEPMKNQVDPAVDVPQTLSMEVAP
jgi:rare lipoprotein A